MRLVPAALMSLRPPTLLLALTAPWVTCSPCTVPVYTATAEKPPPPSYLEAHPVDTSDRLACPTSMKAARSKERPVAPADKAVVVFVRPSDARADTEVIVVDDGEAGGGARFLGQSQASSFFAVTVAPGEHRFLAWANDAAGLRATLAPGKRYYVEVAVDFGIPSHTRLSAVGPSRKSWRKLPEWLGGSAALVPDEGRGQACLALESKRLAEWVTRSRAALAGYDASDLAERTLAAGDGE
jgi:hypothetical protein